MTNRLLSTTLLSGQGLGNQLWAYASTRSISERLGMDFCLRGLDAFKGGDFLELSIDLDLNSKHLKYPFLTEPPFFYEHQYYDPELGLFATAFDERVLGLSASHDLVGYFQSEQYFFGDLEKIKNYIRVNPRLLEVNRIPADIAAINLRGGEYKRFKNLLLPKSYWDHAIHNMQKLYGIEKFVVVTDDYRYAKALFPNFYIISGKISDCYATLSNAKYVIASNSSFGYFPLKTNVNFPVVIAPQHWARFNNPYGRWAGPANLYRDWLWQNINGELSSYQDCLPEVQQTIEFYQNNYCISSPPSSLNRPGLITKLTPKKLRVWAKSVLAIFFPTRIG